VSFPVPRLAAPDKDLLSLLAEGTAGAVGEEFFQRLVEHIAQAFRADVAFVAEVVPEDRGYARLLACWESGGLSAPWEYCLEGTPCAEASGAEIVSYPEGVRERFPHDETIAQLGLDSYLAVALRSSDGAHIGHLGVLATGALYPDDEKLSALRIFAARAAAEIERRRHERALQALAEEQAALRRVATLVAAGAPQRELFDAVVDEVAGLLRADVAILLRHEEDHATIVAGRCAERSVPVGHSFGRGVVAYGMAQILGELQVRSATSAPITVGGRTWGAVTIGRTGENALPAHTQTRLADFTALLAQAIANADAHEQLAASRARIVEAGDAARRRIERNLHDGAQQRLVALSLSLRVAETALAGDPRAERVLARASEELQLTLQELRELARGIHPAVLSERGLDAALEALAGRCSVPVEMAGPGRRLPGPIEATAYYVVAEALTNVAKYAKATAATVAATAAEDCLRVEVRDDGAGGADMARGTGLRGLADRVEALGGTLRVESPPGGGTLVAAAIPL
jgi:signal transduction histidine kinase